MKTRYYFLLLAAALLAGCAKEMKEEILPEEASQGKFFLEVGINPATSTLMETNVGSSHKVFWSDGDIIKVNDKVSDALSSVPANSQVASFSFAEAPSTPYYVLYPSGIWVDASHVSLPAVQTYKADGFADGMFPMAGYSSDGSNITLSHLCAVVKISVLKETAAHAEARSGSVDADNIAAIRFKGHNSEKVSGNFVITYNPAAITPASGTGADLEVRVAKNQATSTSEAVVYYLVVPARTYSNGFDIIVQDVKGHIMTKSKESSKTFAAGHLYSYPEFEFVPTATELGVEISNAQQLIDFATAYNNKEYEALGSSLVATLTGDITFDATSSASFNATGGIGLKNGVNGATEDYYFNGIFNGGDHTISGLTGTCPLFVATAASSTVKDFTIDNTCSFTFTHPGTQTEVGSVVGYHKGLLSGVTVNAPVSLSDAANVAADTRLGGLVGRIREGVVDDCTYSGAISVPSGFSAADKQISIGGLVGIISNAEGKIQNSFFTGTIENEGQMIAASETDDFKANPQLMIGGIIGLNTGTVDNCTVANHATGITVTLNDVSDHNYTGTVVTHSTNAYHYSIAGIAGRNDGTVKDCTNNATVLNIFSAERGTSGNMNGRYLEVSGIVGFNSSGKTVSGCTNNGAIITRANPKVQYVGGVVAWNYGIVSSCENASTATIGMGTSHLSPYGARMSYVGGVIGHNRSSATISNIQNAAAITVSRVESTTGVNHRIGGVIGQSDAVVDGTNAGGTISNSGNIAQSNGVVMCATPTAENDYGYSLGGVVGYATKAVKNVSNGGSVTYTCSATNIGAQYVYLGGIIGKLKADSTVDVEHCSNTANVTFTASAKYDATTNTATRYYYNYLGGIVGYADNAAIKGDVSNHCTNSGIIKGGDGNANNNQKTPSFEVGGIVGCITGASSIAYCELSGSGQSYNDHWSNRGITSYDCPMNGGIAGHVVGTAETPIPVSNCSVSSTVGTSGNQAVFSRRGAVGGIVGMAQYASISYCTVPVNFSGSGYFYGGIAGAAQNSTVSSCSYTGTIIQSSQIQIGGGIVGKLDTGSTVDGCSSSATTVNKNGTAVSATGGIAGQSVAGTYIKNSHYKSSISICGDSNFSDGGEANANDL
ncbi:MAG: hypothetical protein K6F58_00210 [Bacteroidales bacterium]|nr:hypothetical protein [Bacteroidales bacterium]